MDSRYSAILLKHCKQIALKGTLDLRWMLEGNNLSTLSQKFFNLTLAEHLIIAIGMLNV